jgi:hypothetical protein
MQYLFIFLLFLVAFLVSQFLKPLLSAYSTKKGENLATKEDIAQLTQIAEGIKAKISEDVWDRQKQWELRRDVVLDSVRALADLDGAVREFSVAWTDIHGNLTEEAEDFVRKRKIEAITQSDQCRASYQRAHSVADVVIGGELSRNISGYFQCACLFMGKMQSGLNRSDRTTAQKELAKWHNRVILAARTSLGIKDAGDFPVLDYDNESLITDN